MNQKPLLGRWRQHQFRAYHPRALSDEQVREIRWWAVSEDGVALVSDQARARQLAARYYRAPKTMLDVLARRSFHGIEGPPLSVRYWKGREADGWLAWLLWLVFIITARPARLQRG